MERAPGRSAERPSDRGLDPPADLGEGDPETTLARRSGAAEDDLVAVLQEGPLDVLGEPQWLLPGAGELEQAPLRARLRARDRPGGKQVAGAHRRSTRRGVGELLGGAPVEPARVGARDHDL